MGEREIIRRIHEAHRKRTTEVADLEVDGRRDAQELERIEHLLREFGRVMNEANATGAWLRSNTGQLGRGNDVPTWPIATLTASGIEDLAGCIYQYPAHLRVSSRGTVFSESDHSFDPVDSGVYGTPYSLVAPRSLIPVLGSYGIQPEGLEAALRAAARASGVELRPKADET